MQNDILWRMGFYKLPGKATLRKKLLVGQIEFTDSEIVLSKNFSETVLSKYAALKALVLERIESDEAKFKSLMEDYEKAN